MTAAEEDTLRRTAFPSFLGQLLEIHRTLGVTKWHWALYPRPYSSIMEKGLVTHGNGPVCAESADLILVKKIMFVHNQWIYSSYIP